MYDYKVSLPHIFRGQSLETNLIAKACGIQSEDVGIYTLLPHESLSSISWLTNRGPPDPANPPQQFVLPKHGD